MPIFRYDATDDSGQSSSGTIEAVNRYVAVARLLGNGLHVKSIEEEVRESLEPETSPTSRTAEVSTDIQAAAALTAAGRLSRDEQLEVTSAVSDVVRGDLPLGPGLRALSGELPSRRTRRALLAIADRLDRGEPLDQAVVDHLPLVPEDLQVLIKAGLRTGQLAELLEQYLHYARSGLDTRRRTWLALAYPALLMLSAAAICIAIMAWIVPQFESLFEGFGLSLPWFTILVLDASHVVTSGWFLLPVGIFAAISLGWWFFGLSAGPLRQQWLYALPVLGRLSRLTSMSRFCHLLAIGVDHSVPLSEALRMAGRGTGDPYVEYATRTIAGDVERGQSLSNAASGRRMLPGLAHVFEWEGRGDAFPEALRTTGDIFAAQARVQSGLMLILVEPFVIFGVSLVIAAIAVALFLPMIMLLNMLS